MYYIDLKNELLNILFLQTELRNIKLRSFKVINLLDDRFIYYLNSFVFIFILYAKNKYKGSQK